MTLKEEIQKIIKGDADDSDKTLNEYSTDASLFRVMPSLVVFPKSVEDIKKLVKFVGEEKKKKKGRNISLTARSGGTDMTGGPLTESIVLVFTRYLNNLIEVGKDYAIVEPGMYYRDFEKETLKKDLFMPSYPASREICAIGGIVSNNAGGEKTLRYGKTDRYVDTIYAVLADGNEYEFYRVTEEELKKKMLLKTFEGKIYKEIFELIEKNYDILQKAKPDVTKNSSGYALWDVYDKKNKTFDIAKIMVGSQGTLGIFTKIKFKLIHPQKVSKLLIIFLKDFSLIGELSSVISPLKPETFEAYDDNTIKLAIRFFPEILQKIKGNIFKIIFNTLPEFWILITSGIPKLVLLVEFSGQTTEEVNSYVKIAKKTIEEKVKGKFKMRIIKSDEEARAFWVVRRESFNLLRQHVRGLRTAPFIDDFSVRALHLPEFLPRLYEILNQYKILYTIAGHVGDGNFHIIPLMDLSDHKSIEIIKTLSKKVYDLVLEFNGTITSEHNDGIIRTPFLLQAYGGEVYGLFEKTKYIFDPLNIFNPGKKVNGTFDYAEKHFNIENK